MASGKFNSPFFERTQGGSEAQRQDELVTSQYLILGVRLANYNSLNRAASTQLLDFTGSNDPNSARSRFLYTCFVSSES